MEHNWLLYLAAFASAFGITLVFAPFVKKLAIKLGAIDYPRKRGMHNVPIPRMGGLSIVLGFMTTVIILMPFVDELLNVQFLGFMIGATIIVIVGMLDDVFQLKAKSKLLFQIIAAIVVISTGTKINVVMWPFVTNIEQISGPITLIWIIGLTNAVNLIDGVDGLAAGVSSIAALCITFLCVLSGSPLAVVLAATLAGSCLGFLPRNFSPAEVFMGDTGSLFLGFVLSVSSIIGVFKSYAFLSVAIACCAFALPIFDTLFAMIRRAISGKPLMEADRGHLHHRLIDAGNSPRRTVIILYAVSVVCGFIAVAIALKDIRVLLVALLFICMLWLMFAVYKKRLNK